MKKGLNNNQLKLIALLTMTVDHIGVVLFPGVMWLRLIGRLAFPIFAFMIAEGCHYTRSMPKYVATMGIVAAVCQVVYFFAMDSLYQCIMVTFTMSALLIWLLKRGQQTGNALWWVLAGLGIAASFFVCEVLPAYLKNTDFYVDYGFLGVMLPVLIYACPKKWMKLLIMVPPLAVMSVCGWAGQWASLLTVPLLALYNGQRGKLKMKWLFYIYYPAHLVAIQGIYYLFGLL